MRRRDVLGGAAGGLLAGCGSESRHVKPVGLAGLVTDADRIVRIEAQGFRRNGSRQRVAAGDLWHIGSNAKAMTAMLYARLAEQGRASWGASLQDLFPGVAIHESWRGIAVEQLMSHTAGLTDEGLIGVWQLIKSELDERPLPQQRLALAAKAFSAPPRGRRGEFAYSNANYVVLGSAIEQRTGGPWEDAVRRELFQPLGMASAGFGAPSGDQPLGHRPSWLPWKGPRPVQPGPSADNPAFMRPAGGVHLSLEDYSKFLRLFLKERDSFLSVSSMQRLVAPRSKAPAYALGWLVEDLPWAGRNALLHDGSNTMWYATAVVSPERGLAAVAVSNEGSQTAASATHALARKLLEQAR
ncbi:MAG TPA: serine hydrolase domain-containing protein [Allosphingosinicella sp.]|jgi:CubicO group peptidase (beta-lactamase class C family)